MNARYLVRFDDICPTMNWRIWDRVEPVLRRHNVKPIVAVVPDNRDPQLVAGPPRAGFWDIVRDWQQAGWAIALHGHQHRYTQRNAGLLGINDFSEFAGVPEEMQRRKLDAALAVFTEQGLRADAWVAPAHSFDEVTVKLLLEAGIPIVSDGFYTRPVRHLGAIWIPQQLWRFHSMPFGLWTVCYHPNNFSEAGLARFEADIERHAPSIVALLRHELIESAVPPRGLGDRGLAALWLTALRLKRLLPSAA